MVASLAVFGFGNVGRVLARQTLDIGQRVVAVADSSCVLVSSKGFSYGDLESLGNDKQAGKRLSDMNIKGAEVISNPEDALKMLASKNNLDCVTDCSAFADPKTYVSCFLCLTGDFDTYISYYQLKGFQFL